MHFHLQYLPFCEVLVNFQYFRQSTHFVRIFFFFFFPFLQYRVCISISAQWGSEVSVYLWFTVQELLPNSTGHL